MTLLSFSSGTYVFEPLAIKGKLKAVVACPSVAAVS